MKWIRLISLFARVALMVTLVLGLAFWIAQPLGWIGLLTFLVRIGFPGIHEAFGTSGILGLLILGGMAVSTEGSKRLGAGSIIYALAVPVVGLTQTQILGNSLHWLVQVAHLLLGIGAMLLILRIEKRFQSLKRKKQEEKSARTPGRPYSPSIARLARLAVAGHVTLYRLSGGTIAGRIQHMPVLLLTTLGRKSGKQHTTALVYMPDGDDFVVVASNGGQARLPNWWLNMRKNKQASIEVGRKRLRVRVEEANAEERQRLWPRLIAYRAGHEAYQKQTPYPLPLVILHPEDQF